MFCQDIHANSFIEECLVYAEKGRGACAPNPAVGAILVKNNQVISIGYHESAGKPHAEIMAILQAGEAARGATLYVSLEPCGHWGKTPPCADEIIKAGISTVYYGYADPNPVVTNTGITKLKEASIPCEKINSPAVDEFYRSYHHWLQHNRPWVTAKLAISLDGKIAGENGQRVQLTGESALAETHQQRKRCDAILTTARTIIMDDPQLNVRLGGEIQSKSIYILDRTLSLPLQRKIVQTAKSITIFHQDDVSQDKKNLFQDKGINLKCIDASQQYLSLSEVMRVIGEDGIHDLFIEAGGCLLENLIQEKWIHRMIFHIAPLILGENATSAFLYPNDLRDRANNIKPSGRDIILSFDFTEDK